MGPHKGPEVKKKMFFAIKKIESDLLKVVEVSLNGCRMMRD